MILIPLKIDGPLFDVASNGLQLYQTTFRVICDERSNTVVRWGKDSSYTIGSIPIDGKGIYTTFSDKYLNVDIDY